MRAKASLPDSETNWLFEGALLVIALGVGLPCAIGGSTAGLAVAATVLLSVGLAAGWQANQFE